MTRTVILLVDDEKTVLDSLSEQLRRLYPQGIECEVAESAAEAWELLRELSDDHVAVMVVVSDWLMPGQRGDEFPCEVRAAYPHIGRVMLTGQADPAALERARTAGVVHRILFKPWRPEDLRVAIAEASEAAS
jgi:CheY-like chemotaxis protein